MFFDEKLSSSLHCFRFQEMLEYIHNNYLRRWLIRDVNSLVHDEDILLAYRRLAYK